MLASPNSRPASPPRQWQTSSLEENYTPVRDRLVIIIARVLSTRSRSKRTSHACTNVTLTNLATIFVITEFQIGMVPVIRGDAISPKKVRATR